jgi:hypothetical protein
LFLSWSAEPAGEYEEQWEEQRGEGQVQEPGQEAQGGEEQLQGYGRGEEEGTGGT